MTAKRLLKLVRWTALVSAVLFAVLGPAFGARLSLPSCSPLIALCASLGAPGAAGWTVAVGLVLLLVIAWRVRWFCRWVCPVGLMLDGCHRVCPRPRRIPKLRPGPVGIWLFLLTVGGAGLGYPLFAWLDPLALLSGTASVWRSGWGLAAIAAALGIPLLLLLEWLQPRLWCGRLCPLGGMQDFLALWQRRFWKARGAQEGGAPKPAPGFGRRPVLGVLGGLATVWAGRALGWAGNSRVVRPPGAAGKEKFTGLCVRCGSCMAACPSKILRPDSGTAGWSGMFAPIADFSTDYCREDCARCVNVCPSGALARLSQEKKRQWKMGIAELDLGLCVLASGGECTACITHCPYAALSVGSSDDGFGSQPILQKELCVGCGACEAFCPAQPRRAIVVKSEA